MSLLQPTVVRLLLRRAVPQQLLQLVRVDDGVKLGCVVAAVGLRVFTALLSVMRHATCSNTATSPSTCDWGQFYELRSYTTNTANDEQVLATLCNI